MAASFLYFVSARTANERKLQPRLEMLFLDFLKALYLHSLNLSVGFLNWILENFSRTETCSTNLRAENASWSFLVPKSDFYPSEKKNEFSHVTKFRLNIFNHFIASH